MEKIICSYGCGKEAKYFFKTGKGCCEKSPNSCEGKRNKDSEKKKGIFKGTPAWLMPGYKTNLPIVSWNKGLTKETDKRIFEYSKKISNTLKGGTSGRGSTPEIEEERKRKISETMKKNPLSGGLRKGSGRGKKGRYKGYWCDSSWELAWVIYNIEHNIKFERNNVGFEYEYKGQKRKYHPDFLITETYYEIKGRRSFEKMDDENKEKIKQFKFNLKVLYEKDMKPYLTYVISKYGKDYIRLYE
jgi:hypothetical protein